MTVLFSFAAKVSRVWVSAVLSFDSECYGRKQRGAAKVYY